MSEKQTTPSDDLTDLLGAASTALGRGPLTSVGDPLAGSLRNRVVRASDWGGRSVVVKQYLSDPSYFVRESAALAALSGFPEAPTPRLLAEDRDRRLVVMSDEGTGAHLAGRLLGPDPHVAASALDAWASAIGRMHAAGPGLREAFRAELADRRAVLEVPAADPSFLEDAALDLASGLASLGITVSEGALAAVQSLGHDFETTVDVLTPTDACPDNNVLSDDGRTMTLLDFEGAEVRHAALDAAYLLVPWPSCWCAWGLDKRVASHALAIWRETVARTFPQVLTSAFDRDLVRATTLWRWVAMGWFVDRALDEDPADVGAAVDVRPSPTRRQRISAAARGAATDPHGISETVLTDLATEIAAVTEERWGRLDTALAPAFR